MPKRKREDDIEEVFSRCKNEVHHALKTAKGFERQRQSKRLHDPRVPADKKARIENEVAVLKSLDLHQAAHAHLCSALLRIKSIAESPKLPAEIKAGIPKPDLTEEERAALHNVTSGLSSRQEVKSATDKSIVGICKALGVPVPEKKGKGKDKKREERPETAKEEKTQSQQPDDEHEVDEDDEERAVAELDDLLNNSSGEEGSEVEAEEAPRGDNATPAARTQAKATARSGDRAGASSSSNSRHKDPLEGLDPMEITDDEGGDDDEDDDSSGDESELDDMEITSDEDDGEGDAISDSESESSEFQGFSDAPSVSHDTSDEDESSSSEAPSPPPKKSKKAKSTASQPGGSTFLPTLMGGYISGSDSEASDLELAPKTKNRRGQRARQAIWEKRFKSEAKHLKKQQQQGRDAGWDARRGAVEGEAGKLWKRGIRNPLSGGGRDGAGEGGGGEKTTPPVRKRDDTGLLHPSWEAKRKAKEAQRASAPFQGKKITFD